MAILREHLIDKVPVSEVCDKHGFQPTPYYPQSDGKLERWHRSIKSECIRPGVPLRA